MFHDIPLRLRCSLLLLHSMSVKFDRQHGYIDKNDIDILRDTAVALMSQTLDSIHGTFRTLSMAVQHVSANVGGVNNRADLSSVGIVGYEPKNMQQRI